jgi:hypothetical protein
MSIGVFSGVAVRYVLVPSDKVTFLDKRILISGLLVISWGYEFITYILKLYSNCMHTIFFCTYFCQ